MTNSKQKGEHKRMYYKEFRAIIEGLETAHNDTISSSNNPHETARRFIRSVGADTAAQCVAAMVRRLSWDGRISRTAKAWAESVSLSDEWSRRIDEAYSDRIHAAHLSQIAEALAAEPEHAAAEDQKPATRYLEQVEQADSLDQLDTIAETAANDESISTAEYEQIQAAAIRKDKERDDKGIKTYAFGANDSAGRLIELKIPAKSRKEAEKMIKSISPSCNFSFNYEENYI